VSSEGSQVHFLNQRHAMKNPGEIMAESDAEGDRSLTSVSTRLFSHIKELQDPLRTRLALFFEGRQTHIVSNSWARDGPMNWSGVESARRSAARTPQGKLPIDY
jgi:hypothetical protein